jgi:hypothetical protein
MKNAIVSALSVDASFASFVNSWEADGLRLSLTKSKIHTQVGEKISKKGVDRKSKCHRMDGQTIWVGTGCGCS